LLKAVPGVGAVKAAALLEQAGIDPDRRAAGLGERQRATLIAALD
jgi:ribosomal protein S13